MRLGAHVSVAGGLQNAIPWALEINADTFQMFSKNQRQWIAKPLTEEEIEGLNKLLFQTKDFIKKKYNPDGFNVGINSGKDAGQTVFHMHIHLIPRYKNDVKNPRGGVRNVIPGKGDY